MHYWHKRKLSAYIDDELTSNEAEMLETHLQNCRRCQDELTEIREAKAASLHFEKPAWQASENLWARLQAAKSEPNSTARLPQMKSGRLLRLPQIPQLRSAWLWAIVGSIAALFVARNVIQMQITKQPGDASSEWPVQTASTFAIDFGLYLDALKDGKEPVEFERRYHSRVTTYDVAQSKAHLPLPPLPRIPKAFELSEVQTLKSACCFSVQINCVSDSERIVIFRQPKDHPATFGSYQLFATEMNGRACFRIEVAGWTMLCWDDESSQYVVVSQLEDGELARALHEIM